MTPEQSPTPEEVVKLLESRIGRDFDGECLLTEEEARQAASLIRSLVEALEPFAELADETDGFGVEQPLTVWAGDCRRARSALRGVKNG